jgi:hypothetical protein
MATELPIDLNALRNAEVTDAPFPHLIVPHFVKAWALADIEEDFPKIEHAGSFPLPTLRYGRAFSSFVDALQ